MLFDEYGDIGEGTESVDLDTGTFEFINVELKLDYTCCSYLLNLIRDIARTLFAVLISL
jgi:hypothetical protein